MTYAAFGNDDIYQSQLPYIWDQTPSYAPTPGRECTPSLICSTPDPDQIFRECSSPFHQPQSEHLGFRQVDEQNGGGGQEDRRLNNVLYQIEWKVKLNNRVVAKNTEQDLALPPSSYWEQIRETAGNVLRRKIARNRRVRLDDTNLVVSVNDRSQCDLTKRFEGAGTDWTLVEK
jgi:hypothetical protein